MIIEKNTTAEEVAKFYSILLFNYTNGDGEIYDASAIQEAAVENVKGNLDDLLEATTLLGEAYQVKLLEFVERIIASSYLAAAAEVIKKKQKVSQSKI